MREFVITDWYWQVGSDTTRFWSSAAGNYVQADDAAYLAFLADDVTPARAFAESDLRETFAAYSYTAGGPKTQREQIDATYTAFLEAGMAWTLGVGQVRIQCRNDSDKVNWLMLKTDADVAVQEGDGAVSVPIPVRDAENANHTVTYAEALAMTQAVLAWYRAAMANWWTMKDADASGEVVDLAAGWPT